MDSHLSLKEVEVIGRGGILHIKELWYLLDLMEAELDTLSYFFFKDWLNFLEFLWLFLRLFLWFFL